MRLRMMVLMLALVSVVAVGSGAFAQNLLSNADFKAGKPGEASFGWTFDLAKGQKSECAVVAGRKPGTSAIRLYNDELGASFVSQEIKVQPWRWYAADVWVNTEGMALFDFAPTISLSGGRGVAGESWIYDSVNGWPQKGWRKLTALAHSGDNERLTFKVGGGGIAGAGAGWSGDILICEPVVRECSLVEAASHYPGVNNRHPTLYGLAPDPAKNQQGSVIQRGDICRVAPDFPNSLYLYGSRNNDAPEARISLVLPPGVRFLKLTARNAAKLTPTETANGFQRVELPAATGQLIVKSTLKPGEQAIGYVQFEWKGGFQTPSPVLFVGVAKPRIIPPKRAVVYLGIGGGDIYYWNDDVPKLCRDLKGFGFNHLEIWGGDPRGFYKNGMVGVTAPGASGGPRPSGMNQEGQAVRIDGQPCGEDIVSPSYRGPGLKYYIDQLRHVATMSSMVLLDDENYGCSAQSPAIGFEPATVERWGKWVAERHPELPQVDFKAFTKQPHKYMGHYYAYLDFRSELIAEMYGIWRDEFHKAVKETGVKTSPKPVFGAYVGDDPIHSLTLNKSLAKYVDLVANMVYDDAPGVRKTVARLAPGTGKKLVVAISPGYQMSPPGDTRSAVLEAVMGGSQGIIAWGYYMGMDTGHLADMADAVRMFSQVEDTILDGAVQTGYRCSNVNTNISARKLGKQSALLVSDYTPNPGVVKVTVPGIEPLVVKDLFTGNVIAKLTKIQRSFPVELRRDFCARLYSLVAGK